MERITRFRAWLLVAIVAVIILLLLLVLFALVGKLAGFSSILWRESMLRF